MFKDQLGTESSRSWLSGLKKGRILLLMMHLEQLPATPMLEVGSMCVGPLSAALSRFVVEGDEMKITSYFF